MKLHKTLNDNKNNSLDENELYKCIEVDRARLELIKQTVKLFVPELKKYTKEFTVGYDLSGTEHYFITINFNVNLFCSYSKLKTGFDAAKIKNIRLFISSYGELSILIKIRKSYLRQNLYYSGSNSEIEENYSEILLHPNPNITNKFVGPAAVGDLFKLVCKENCVLTDDEKTIKDIIE
jgi:hypothetical protein